MVSHRIRSLVFLRRCLQHCPRASISHFTQIQGVPDETVRSNRRVTDPFKRKFAQLTFPGFSNVRLRILTDCYQSLTRLSADSRLHIFAGSLARSFADLPICRNTCSPIATGKRPRHSAESVAVSQDTSLLVVF